MMTPPLALSKTYLLDRNALQNEIKRSKPTVTEVDRSGQVENARLRSRGTGSRGVESKRSSGKHRVYKNVHGVWWETRGNNYFAQQLTFLIKMRSRNFVIQIAMKMNRRETRLSIIKRILKTFCEKGNHSNANVPCSGFLLHEASVLFFAE